MFMIREEFVTSNAGQRQLLGNRHLQKSVLRVTENIHTYLSFTRTQMLNISHLHNSLKHLSHPRSYPPPSWQIFRSQPLTPQLPSPTNRELYSSRPE
jgi:hypothetical protein